MEFTLNFIKNTLPISIKRLSLFSLFFLTHTAFAALTITPNPLPNITLNAWAGTTGNLQGTSNFCVISSRNNNNRRNFDVAGYQITPSGTPGFVVAHTVSGHRLNISFIYNGHTGTSYTLTNYSVTGFVTPLTQGSLNCTEGASSITLVLNAAELSNAQAGVYQATLGIDFLQSGGGGAYSGVLPFQVTVPRLTQISRLNDATLTPTGILNNRVAIEPFCIFRNGQGGFTLTATGNNDAGGTFRLKNVFTVPYKVEMQQTGAYYNIQPGVPLSSTTTGFTGASIRDCGGADNMRIRLTLLGSDAATVPNGTYTDALVIMIAPL
jgi:hypothetical protein